MERIMDRKTGRAVIIPMDHGISNGPMAGLYDMRETVDNVTNGGATAVIMHKGLIRYSYLGSGKDVGLIMHLSASTDVGTNANHKVDITTVEEAIKYGADAVSIHITSATSTSPRCSGPPERFPVSATSGGCPSS